MRISVRIFELTRRTPACNQAGVLQTVEKARRAFSTWELHAGYSAVSCMWSVISEAHVPGNDGFDFISAMRGGNSAKLFYCKQVLQNCL